MGNHKKRKLVKFVWTNEHVDLLLSLWGNKMKGKEQFKMPEDMYREIQKDMKFAFPTITEDNIFFKIKNLTNQYRKELRAMAQNATVSAWQWFEPLHEILQEEVTDDYSTVESDEENIVVKSSPRRSKANLGHSADEDSLQIEKKLSWTAEKLEMFFQLWSKNHKEGKKRAKLCKDIATEMSPKFPDVTCDEVLKKFDSLKATYRSELKKIEESGTSNWKWFEQVNEILSTEFTTTNQDEGDNSDLEDGSRGKRRQTRQNAHEENNTAMESCSPSSTPRPHANLEHSKDERGSNKRRKYEWTDEKHELLFQLWSKNMQGGKKCTNMWEVIAREMSSRFPGATKDNVRDTILNLKHIYRQELRNIEESDGACSNWKWFNQIKEIMGNQPDEDGVQNMRPKRNIAVESSIPSNPPRANANIEYSADEGIQNEHTALWRYETYEMFFRLWAKGFKERKKRSKMCTDIATEMSSKYPGMTYEEVEKKHNNFMKFYRSELRKMAESGTCSKWKWYNQVHTILGPDETIADENDNQVLEDGVQNMRPKRNALKTRQPEQVSSDAKRRKTDACEETSLELEGNQQNAHEKSSSGIKHTQQNVHGENNIAVDNANIESSADEGIQNEQTILWRHETYETFFRLWSKAFKERKKRAKMCTDIATEMSSKYPGMTYEEVKKKHDIFIRFYHSELKKMEESGTCSRWKWYKQVHKVLGPEETIADENDNQGLEDGAQQNAPPATSTDVVQNRQNTHEEPPSHLPIRKHWSDDETDFLLEQWRLKKSDPRCDGIRGKLTGDIAEEVLLKYPRLTVAEVRAKIKNLTAQYKRYLSTVASGGEPPRWSLFTKLREILGTLDINDDNRFEGDLMTDNLEQAEMVDCVPDFLPNYESYIGSGAYVNENLQEMSALRGAVIEKFDIIDKRLQDQLEQKKATDAAMLELEKRKVELFEKLVKDHAELKQIILKKSTNGI